MKSRKRSGEHRFIIAWIGAYQEHENQRNCYPSDEQMKKFLPSKVLQKIAGKGYSVSNVAMPGCVLTSTATFDKIVQDIDSGNYAVVKVLALNGKPPQEEEEEEEEVEQKKKPKRMKPSEANRPDAPFSFSCSHCGRKYTGKPEQYGKLTTCKKCGKKTKIQPLSGSVVPKPQTIVEMQLVRKCSACGYVETCDVVIQAHLEKSGGAEGEKPPGSAIECCKCARNSTKMLWRTKDGKFFDTAVKA